MPRTPSSNATSRRYSASGFTFVTFMDNPKLFQLRRFARRDSSLPCCASLRPSLLFVLHPPNRRTTTPPYRPPQATRHALRPRSRFVVASLAPLVSPFGLPPARLMLACRSEHPFGAQPQAVSISNCMAVSGSPRSPLRRWSAFQIFSFSKVSYFLFSQVSAFRVSSVSYFHFFSPLLFTRLIAKATYLRLRLRLPPPITSRFLIPLSAFGLGLSPLSAPVQLFLFPSPPQSIG